MIGALIGDIVGSRFEFNNHKSKDFELFTPDCFMTDDSVMTLAIAKAIMESGEIKDTKKYYNNLEKNTIIWMQRIGQKYPYSGYGKMFKHWIFSYNPLPYESFGNGAAMRVSPVGFIANDEKIALKMSKSVTEVTHNHDEGIKGADAVTIAIFLAKNSKSKEEIKKRIEKDYYKLDFKIDDIRDEYEFDETCQHTVPQAIECFLESKDFEDTIRIAISLGGDSDTIACIAGAIASAFYEVSDEMTEDALEFLPKDLRNIYQEFKEFI